MLIERLELRNFEGYRRAVIDFAEGLNVITGRNSTGKTTILEALLFAIYGAVPGSEKGLLVSRLQGASGSMSVRLTARIAGKSVEVFREGRLMGRGFRTERLSLKVDGRIVPVHTEEELNRKIIEMVGVGAKVFTSLIYARQGEFTSILEPKKEDMDLILGITLMKELAEQLDAAKKILEKYDGKDAKTILNQLRERELPLLAQQIGDLEKHERNLSGEIERLREVVDKAKSREVAVLLQKIDQRDFLRENIGKICAAISSILSERGAASMEDLERELSEVFGKEASLQRRLEELQIEEVRASGEWQRLNSRLLQIKAYLNGCGAATLEDLEGKMVSAQAEYDRIVRDLEAAEMDLDKIERLRSELSGKMSALREEVKSHEDLLAKRAANCPMCGQRINQDLVKQLIEAKKRSLEQLAANLNIVEAQYSSLKGKVEELRVSTSKIGMSLASMQEAHDRIITLLEGATVEYLDRRLREVEKSLGEIRQNIGRLGSDLAGLKKEEETLKGAIANVRRLDGERARLEGELRRRLEEIGFSLKALSLPFKPDDADLKAKIAERLPLSPEELARKERELNEKTGQLDELRARLEDLKRREKEVKDKISVLERRLERAKICGELLEKIRSGVEERRRQKLKRIADEALRIYGSLTDQRVYRAFRINEDDYSVEVSPERLEGYIPAKRVGGGHQTLIALAIRVALLNVLNRRSLLILDEPTYGVDSENLPQLMSYLSEAAKKIGQTILVTHYGLGEEEAANIIKVSIGEDGSSVASRA